MGFFADPSYVQEIYQKVAPDAYIARHCCPRALHGCVTRTSDRLAVDSCTAVSPTAAATLLLSR